MYAPSNMAERFYRLNPETGEIIAYQWPTEFDTKKINYDPTTNRAYPSPTRPRPPNQPRQAPHTEDRNRWGSSG